MPSKLPSRQLLTRQVLQILTQKIVAGGLVPNDRLPTEHQLAAELHVSRNTVREALGSLEAIGAIVRRPKRGAVLQPVDLSALAGISQVFLLRSAADFAELLVARRTFEIGLLPLVAQHATPHDFQQMEAANALIEAEVAAGWAPIEGDLAFHKAILHASHNRFLIQFGKLLEEFFRASRDRAGPDQRVSQRTLREHRQIIRALMSGDARAAQRLMGRHLNPRAPRRRVRQAATTDKGQDSRRRSRPHA
jgi:GntR family transcriptional regulator, transcriptional repressor for pyruvate dehydrogenase complex